MFERLAFITQRILCGQRFNAATVAKKLSVASKTIHQDLIFLKVSLGIQFHYNHENHCYEASTVRERKANLRNRHALYWSRFSFARPQAKLPFAKPEHDGQRDGQHNGKDGQ